MSLMRLLAVGRSIGTISDEPTRYRMRVEGLLPKFGTARSAPSAAVPADLATDLVSECRSTEEQSHAAPHSSTRSAVADKPESPMNTEVLEQIPSAPAAPVAESSQPRQAYPLGRWRTLRNPFAAKSAVRAGGAVQTELSLDAVRPIRNDLNEDDLEVQPAPPPPPAAPRPHKRGFWATLWQRLPKHFPRFGRP